MFYANDPTQAHLYEMAALALVTLDGRALERIPKASRTPEIILAAVTQQGCALEYVPEALKTPKIISAAIAQDGRALEYVPTRFMSPEIILAAVTNRAANQGDANAQFGLGLLYAAGEGVQQDFAQNANDQ